MFSPGKKCPVKFSDGENIAPRIPPPHVEVKWEGLGVVPVRIGPRQASQGEDMTGPQHTLAQPGDP